MASSRPTRSQKALLVGSLAWVLAACSTPAATPTSAPPAAAPTTAPAATPVPQAQSAPTTAAAAAKPSGTPIKVGVMDDVTGVGAIEGALMRVSTDLVVQRTNASGGINGRPLEVTYVDPKGDATQAINLATQLAQQDNVDVLAGGLFSPECIGVSQLRPKLKMANSLPNGSASDVLTS